MIKSMFLEITNDCVHFKPILFRYYWATENETEILFELKIIARDRFNANAYRWYTEDKYWFCPTGDERHMLRIRIDEIKPPLFFIVRG